MSYNLFETRSSSLCWFRAEWCANCGEVRNHMKMSTSEPLFRIISYLWLYHYIDLIRLYFQVNRFGRCTFAIYHEIHPYFEIMEMVQNFLEPSQCHEFITTPKRNKILYIPGNWQFNPNLSYRCLPWRFIVLIAVPLLIDLRFLLTQNLCVNYGSMSN